MPTLVQKSEPRFLAEDGVLYLQGKIGMTESRDLAALERALTQLQRQLPRHSISPALLAHIEELEEEITARRAQIKQTGPVSKIKVQTL